MMSGWLCLLTLFHSLLATHANPSWGHYTLNDVVPHETGIDGVLSFVNGSEPCPYGTPISPLALAITYYNVSIARVKITDPNDPERWEVPDVIQSHPTDDVSGITYGISYTTAPEPFSLKITRNDFPVIPALLQINDLFFADQYLELGFPLLSTSNVYGLGERVAPLRS